MRRLVFSILAVALVIGALGAGTWAVFSDTETSSGNTLAAGTFDLRIRDGNESWRDGVTATWIMTNMKPGDWVEAYVDLKNVGSVKGNTLVVQASNIVIDPPGPASDTEEGTTDMDRVLEIQTCTFTDGGPEVDCKALIADANGNGWKDLDDLEANPVSVPWDATGGVHTWEMKLRFHPSADNRYQGDTLVTTISFTLNQ